DTTLDAAEIAVDLAILDPHAQICVLRGGTVQSGKYQGRRVLGSGINLTHLYHGKVPFIWYLQRDLGIVNKIYRGLARPDAAPDDVTGNTREKPWIAVVEGFAIGGHCQYLLVMDYVLAAQDAFMSLPARKEGIIPGAANRAGAARSVPELFRPVRARAGLLPLQPGADRKPRAQLEREEPQAGLSLSSLRARCPTSACGVPNRDSPRGRPRPSPPPPGRRTCPAAAAAIAGAA